MTIFRIVQESQNNTIKHAAASRADFSLYRKDGFVYVEFIDDGVGFTTQKSSGDRSFGIIGMRERAKALGATFEIVSNKGKGTSVKLVIPCKRQEGTDALSHC
jgi:signal transduction histidine kinase